MTISTYEPPAAAIATTTDPTGGRLVAWAEAASAANQLAKALSQTAFVPREMQNVGNATAAILAGDEVGMSPLASLRSFYVVHGTPALYARAMVALAQAHGHEIWTSESTDSKVTVHGRRRGTDNTETATWTIQRAQKAGYTSNKKYGTNPQEMLYSKAAAEIARKIAADVLAGMPYSVEDLELDSGPATSTVTRPSGGTSKVSRAKKPEPEPEPTTSHPDAGPDDTPVADAIADDPGDVMTARSRGEMFALFDKKGADTREKQIKAIKHYAGVDVDSRGDLTEQQALDVINGLRGLKDVPKEQQNPEDIPDEEFAGLAGEPDAQ